MIRPPPDPGSPEDPDQGRELAPGAEVELGFGRDLDVVADPHRGTELVFERRPEREAAVPAGQVLGRGDDAGLLVGVAGRADPDPGQVLAAHSGGLGRLPHRRRHLPGDVRRAAAGRGRVPRFAEDLALGVDDRGLDLGPAEVDAAAQCGCCQRAIRAVKPEAVGRVVGDHEERSADDHEPVVPVTAAAGLVDRHLRLRRAPVSTPISSWLTGSSLTLTPTRVTFSPSAGDSIVSAVIPDLTSVAELQPGPVPDGRPRPELVVASLEAEA